MFHTPPIYKASVTTSWKKPAAVSSRSCFDRSAINLDLRAFCVNEGINVTLAKQLEVIAENKLNFGTKRVKLN